MASKQDTPHISDTDKLNAFLLLKLKTAVAVAIIKSKPGGMSGREFSEKLASNLREQNENWKKRAEDLQSEVLSLKQELLLRKTNNMEEPHNTKEPRESVQEMFSMDLFGPNVDTERLMEDDSETPDLLMDITTNTYIRPASTANTTATPTANTTAKPATAAASTPAVPASVFGESQVLQPLPHVQFLQALCGLQPFSCRPPESLVFGLAPEVGPVLEESVSQLLHSVLVSFRASTGGSDPCPAPSDAGSVSPGREALLWAAQVSASALDVYCSSRIPSQVFTQTLEELMKGLTKTLLISEDQAQDSVSDCVLTLARSRLLRCLLIRQTISHLSDFTEQLWTLHQTPDPNLGQFPLLEFGNSCRLMWLLELMLMPNSTSDEQNQDQPTRSNDPIPVDVSSVRDTLERMQKRVFPLSQEFPLFSVCLWRVLGLVRNQPNNNKTQGDSGRQQQGH